MRQRVSQLLIIGTLPPPVGGVTVHVDRLIKYLASIGYKYDHVDLRHDSLYNVGRLFFVNKVIHLHISRSYLRFLIVLIGRILKKDMIITIHGSLGRFNRFNNYLDYLSIKMVKVPILVNDFSYKISYDWNKQSVLIPAYIPAESVDKLELKYLASIKKLRQQTHKIFYTYAPHRSLDKFGHEIYQIELLVSIFNKLKNFGLIILDPSGSYFNYLSQNNYKMGQNILIINQPQSLIKVGNLSDIFLRITTTDGDSLSIKEALSIGKLVVATDCVFRPKGVYLTSLKPNEILASIQSVIDKKPQRYTFLNNAILIKNLYDKLLNEK